MRCYAATFERLPRVTTAEGGRLTPRQVYGPFYLLLLPERCRVCALNTVRCRGRSRLITQSVARGPLTNPQPVSAMRSALCTVVALLLSLSVSGAHAVTSVRERLADRRHHLCQDDRKFMLVDAEAGCSTPTYGFADVLHVFEAHRIEWNIFGRDDPWWSVDTAVQRGSNVPPAVRATFYQSGDEWLSSARSPALPLLQAYGGLRSNALDFGCGLGRLSLTLAGYFDSVTCVDQSIYHLQRAKKETALHSPQRAAKIRFVLSGPNLLSAVQGNSYDYVLSLIALQHCVTELQVLKCRSRKPVFPTRSLPCRPRQLLYVEQLCDVLKLGGLGYIQIPTYSAWGWVCLAFVPW